MEWGYSKILKTRNNLIWKTLSMGTTADPVLAHHELLRLPMLDLTFRLNRTY